MVTQSQRLRRKRNRLRRRGRLGPTMVPVAAGRRSKRRVNRRAIARPFLSQMGEEYIRCALGLGNENAIGIPDEVTDLTFAMKLRQNYTFTCNNSSGGDLDLAFIPTLGSVLHLLSSSSPYSTIGVVWDNGLAQWARYIINTGSGTSSSSSLFPFTDVPTATNAYLGIPFSDFATAGGPNGAGGPSGDGMNFAFQATDWRPVACCAKIRYGGTDLANSGFIASASGTVSSTGETKQVSTGSGGYLSSGGLQQYLLEPMGAQVSFSTLASAMDGMVTRLPEGLNIELKPSRPTVEFMKIQQGYYAVVDTASGTQSNNVLFGLVGANTLSGVTTAVAYPHFGEAGNFDCCFVHLSGVQNNQTINVDVEMCVEMKVNRAVGIARHMLRASPENDPAALALVAEVRKRSPIATTLATSPSRAAIQDLQLNGGNFAGAMTKLGKALIYPFEKIGGFINGLGGPAKFAQGVGNIIGGPFGGAVNSILGAAGPMGFDAVAQSLGPSMGRLAIGY